MFLNLGLVVIVLWKEGETIDEDLDFDRFKAFVFLDCVSFGVF